MQQVEAVLSTPAAPTEAELMASNEAEAKGKLKEEEVRCPALYPPLLVKQEQHDNRSILMHIHVTERFPPWKDADHPACSAGGKGEGGAESQEGAAEG